MTPGRLRGQQGVALLALLAVVALGSTWYLLTRVNEETATRSALNRTDNGEVLNRAKAALIGYIAAQAIKAGENNPGALPCPEAAGYYGDPNQEGKVASSCTTPKVGRFPWRTLGMDKLVDAAGEPLWYVVSPGWTYSGSNPTINSNSVGQLTVDGVANDAVALIIAPGPAFNVAASNGCAAISQVRAATGTPDWRNYLECENATYPTPDATFVTRGASASFNDQVVKITVADLMPAIEAAVAKRIEREIVPALNGVYTPSAWGFSGSNPLYPFAAPFANPSTSGYQGASGTYAGLLPFNQTQNCTPASDARCTTTLLAFSKASNDTQTSGTGYIRTQSTCSWSGSTYICTGQYNTPTIAVTLHIKVTNVTKGLRSFDTSKISFYALNNTVGGWGTQTIPFTATAALASDGSVTISVASGTLTNIVSAGWGTIANYQLNIDRAALGDHALLDSSDATTGWFARNEWYRLLYYATAPTVTAANLPTAPACTTGGNCLTVANMTPSDNKRAILILAGRSINATARPSSTLADYLEFGNAGGSYEQQTITPPGGGILADTGSANAYAVAVTNLASGASLLFRAINANTGASTLNTAATGTLPIVDASGNALAAGAIRAGAAVQVSYNGTRFTLAKRPFNDRVIVVGSN